MRSRQLLLPIALVLALAAQADEPAASELNGFDLSSSSVPRALIVAGGPKRDGIKSVDEPSFAEVKDATWVASSTPVIGLALGSGESSEARAYPVHLLEYHQVVNDEVGGTVVAITYDPLGGAPLAYKASVGGRHLHFGVSGLLYESNFLLYDRETQSLWSQFLGQAIAGPLKGTQLERVRLRQEAFAVWHHRHPETLVLERPMPKHIDYRYSPFTTYWVSERIPYPVSSEDRRFHPKEVVLGLEVDGVSRAYLGSILTAAGGRIVDDLQGRKIRIAYDMEVSVFSWEAPEDVAVTDAYWFAWKTFHPDTEIWNEDSVRPRKEAPAS